MSKPMLHTCIADAVDIDDSTAPPPDHLLLEHLPVAVMLLNGNNAITYYNQAFRNTFKLPVSDSLCGVTWSFFRQSIQPAFVVDGIANDVVDQMLTAQQQLDNNIMELANGTSLAVTYTFNNDGAGNWLHQLVFTNVTSLVQTKNEALDQKKLFENILTHLPSDIAVLSNTFNYLFLNPAAIKDSETRKWMLGRNDFDYCYQHQKDIALAESRQKVYKKALSQKHSVEWEEEIVNQKGEKEYHLRKMKPVLNRQNEVTLLIGYGFNITERKKIEDRIQISEKRYRDLFNYCKALICTHDLNGNLMAVNPSLCETVGFSEAEMLTKNLREVLPQEDIVGFETNYLPSMIEGSKAKGVFRVVRNDGKKIYLLYENFKVQEPGVAPYVIGFAHDITDRVSAEKELKIAKKITEETALMKERFLANMSHEIRTPMNGILGMANLLQKTPLTTDQEQFISIINNSAQNLLTIINDILDIEKIAAGEVKIENIPFDLVGKTHSALQLFEYACKEKGVELIFDNQLGKKMPVTGDPTRYNQILNNLLSNAVKFTNTGTITIRTDILKENGEDVTIQFSVLDTGIGMEENKLGKIFEPFTQAYSETTRKYGGTGLGLAITKNLVELQGGTINVKSKLGYGSKFTFTINYKKSAAKEMVELEKEKPKPFVNTLGVLKVLLAEDNEVNQLLARSILMYWGHETRIATTGNEVMALMEEEDFDVILMDIQMPEKSGLEATLEIRALPDKKKSNTPIIALTANALKGEEKKYIAVGMDDFLTKPFKEKELYEVMKRVLDNKGSFGRNLHAQEAGNFIATEVDIVTPVEDRLYDMKSLQEMSRGNAAFLENLAKIFLNTIPGNSTEMVEAADCKNWERVSQLAHKLKSTVDAMNIRDIKQDIRAIEINAKNKADLVNVYSQVQKVDAIIKQVAVQLKGQFSL